MADQPSLFLPTVIDPIGEEGLGPLRKRCLACTKCDLAQTRTQAVFGEGNSESPDICFVGEAPGGYEDETGKPFVGRAGQLLMRMIQAMGYEREQVYLCNVVGCRPPDNRTPEKHEIQACSEFLLGQVRAVRPKVIVALGATALGAMLGKPKKIGDARGKWFEFEGIPMLPTFHPSAVARAERDPNYVDMKKMVWADLQMVLVKLGKKVT